MAVIEGFRVQNYRALRDVTLGKLSGQQAGEPLTPFTVVIGKKRIKRFRDFLKGWYLSYFYPDAARSLPSAGPQRSGI